MIRPNQEEIRLEVVNAIVKAKRRIHTPNVRGVIAADRTNAREVVSLMKINDI